MTLTNGRNGATSEWLKEMICIETEDTDDFDPYVTALAREANASVAEATMAKVVADRPDERAQEPQAGQEYTDVLGKLHEQSQLTEFQRLMLFNECEECA